MGIFSKTKEGSELALVFDIGSSSVGGALFYIQNSGTPLVIFSTREPIALENEIDFDRFLSLTLKSLEKVVNKIYLAKLGSPKKVFCVLSSPWYASQTRIIKFQKETPFIFNSKLADSLIQKEILLFEEENLKKYTLDNSKIRSIELRNMKTTLNGYKIDKPLNQKARELEMTVFISMSPEQVLGKIEETIGQHFYSKNIKFSSFAMASFAVAREIFVFKESFLLIDICGEVTDISMVKKDILRTSISFPMGRNFIIRSIALAMNSSLSEAKSLLSLYKDGHMEKNMEEKFKPIIEPIKTKWLEKFQHSLVNLSNDISIPATIFVTVDQDIADFFIDVIKNEQFNQYTLTESKFQIIFLNTQALHGIASFKENAIRDPFITVESIYINHFLK